MTEEGIAFKEKNARVTKSTEVLKQSNQTLLQ